MNKIAKNASWIIISKVLKSCFSLVIGVISARYLGPSNYGILTYATSLVSFVAPIMYLGINNVIVREIIDNPDAEGEVIGTSFVLNLISAFVCMAGVLCFVSVANKNERETIIVCLLYSLILLFWVFDQITYWFQAKYLSKYSSVINISVYLVVALYKIFLLVAGKSIYWFSLISVFEVSLISVLSILFYFKLGGQKLSFSRERGKIILNASKYYIVSSMMVTIFAEIDKIMIKNMLGDVSTGCYGIAVKLATYSSFIYLAIIDSFRPSILECSNRDKTLFEKRLTVLYSIIIYFSLFQSLIMSLFSKQIITFMYGADYYQAIDALKIIVWFTTFSYLGEVRNIWILSHNLQKYLLVINFCGAISNVILNSLLIPVFGINGAAVASLTTQVFINVIIGFIIRPIRANNALMINGCNPKHFFSAIKVLINRG